MYSPQIDESLIPRLYWIAKSQGIPMTKLVSGILSRAIENVDVEALRRRVEEAQSCPHCRNRRQERAA